MVPECWLCNFIYIRFILHFFYSHTGVKLILSRLVIYRETSFLIFDMFGSCIKYVKVCSQWYLAQRHIFFSFMCLYSLNIPTKSTNPVLNFNCSQFCRIILTVRLYESYFFIFFYGLCNIFDKLGHCFKLKYMSTTVSTTQVFLTIKGLNFKKT